jgi:tRNA threonylcarbamoyl adenosine modification protein (Sua5/YciO/YrdC/YwlC family)
MSDFAFSIIKQCLPGPYTFVLKAKKIMPKLLMTEKKEVGIRIPSHPAPVALAKLIERPIINTSAKISGNLVFSDPRKIDETFKGSLDLVVDGGIVVSEASTVLRLADEKIEILREGKGPFKHLL